MDTMTKDWMAAVAAELIKEQMQDDPKITYVDPIYIMDVIEKHCPFKTGIAYQEVGEDSKKLDKILELVTRIKRNVA